MKTIYEVDDKCSYPVGTKIKFFYTYDLRLQNYIHKGVVKEDYLHHMVVSQTHTNDVKNEISPYNVSISKRDVYCGDVKVKRDYSRG